MSKIYVDEIRPKTSGNQVIFPSRPACCVALTTGNSQDSSSPYTPASGTVIKFDHVILDQGSLYSSSTGLFTASQAGVWEFHFQALTNDTTTTSHEVRLSKNGTIINKGYNSVDNQNVMLTLGTLIYMNEGDYLDVKFMTGQIYIGSPTDTYNYASFKLVG